ncbi:MAG TPA: cytochrome ubiquinol oxidase subunit I [Syntrophorhabdales bacterium]|nr:cytochrome ubiquinol oxidase subunit I [Syntrophorhabdales bacterium]
METLAGPVFLSRLQFALTIGFHILFPTLTIGLGLYLVVVEALWLRAREELYYRMYRFWVKVFAINFAVGVVTGVVMEFQFGTNWSRFAIASANVFSPLLFFEVLTAFFLEAGFLSIMLFGWKRVRPAVHFLATCLVAGGAILSSGWIIAANSWLQTPAGFSLVGGKFMVTDFVAAILNPSFFIRLSHMLLACFETSVFAIAGISAYFLLKGVEVPFYRRSMGVALLMAAILAPLQVYVGDTSGREVFGHQPAKLAAIEGHWETNKEGGAPLSLVGIPDMRDERTLFEVEIPDALSLLVTHTRNGRIPGLKEFAPQDRPNSLVVYWAFRLMAGIGFTFLFVMLWAALLWRRRQLFQSRPFLRTLVAIQPLGWLAVEMGWVTAEVGRQPWLIYNLVRTSEGTSPIPAGNVAWSLGLFVIIFLSIGGSYMYYVLKTLRVGPDLTSPIPHTHMPAGIKVLERLPGPAEGE